MKSLIILLCGLSLMPLRTFAQDYLPVALQYYHAVIKGYPAPSDEELLRGKYWICSQVGTNVQVVAWSAPYPQPSESVLSAVASNAAAWRLEKDLVTNSDLDRMEKLSKALALAMLDAINVLRVKAGLPTNTVEQLKAAVRTKYKELP